MVWRERSADLIGVEKGKGIGRKLIEANLPYVLEGQVELLFHDDGVECRIDFPLHPYPRS